MDYQTTSADVPHSDAEICLNLWYFVDHSGVILRVAARAYGLRGSDNEKLAVLHALAGTDHVTATQSAVPDQFVLDWNGKTIRGAIPVRALPQEQGAVFETLLETIEQNLPALIRSVNENYEATKLRIPADPLCVVTAVIEREDGELIARVTEKV